MHGTVEVCHDITISYMSPSIDYYRVRYNNLWSKARCITK